LVVRSHGSPPAVSCPVLSRHIYIDRSWSTCSKQTYEEVTCLTVMQVCDVRRYRTSLYL
jgi:hypothetical protein